MLNFFKHSYISQHVAVILMSLVLWMPAFITKSAFIPGEHTTPLYNIITSLFDISPLLLNILAFAVFLFSVFFFNSVLSANRLVQKNNTIGSIVFVLLMCCVPQLHSCYPFLFACPFVLMAMHTLFLIYQTENPENYMMNIGYFIAIASLFYYPSVFLMIWIILSFMILGYREIRYLMIPITGFLLINALFVGIVFLFGDIDVLIESYSHYFRNVNFYYDLKGSDKILLIILSILFLISFARTLSNKVSDKGNNVRKRVGVATVLTICAASMFFMHAPLMNNSMIFMMFAFFLSMMLSDIKKTRLANIITIIMTLLIIVNQYLPLFGIYIYEFDFALYRSADGSRM